MNRRSVAILLMVGGCTSASVPGAGSIDGDAGAGDARLMVVDSGDEAARCPTEAVLDAPFAELEGVDPNLLSLDVHPAPGDGPHPAVLFVHGGGWVTGDKTDLLGNESFLQFFRDEGWTLVSTNYHLLRDAGSPEATWEDQPTDVAAAVAWLVANAEALCVDPDRVALMGHSAGAHIVALAATDPTYLGVHGLDPGLLIGVVSMDVNAYDIPFAIANGGALGVPQASANLSRVFTGDPVQQDRASPVTHVSAERDLPPFLVVWAPVFMGMEQALSQAASERFVERLGEAGVRASSVGSLEDDHSGLVTGFGPPGDEPTEAVRSFLRSL